MAKRKAVYPGTFDPITVGHLDVIKRGLLLFDELIIAVAETPNKKTLFSTEERVRLVKECVKGMKGAEVRAFDSLLADFAQKEKAHAILRGLREMSDFPLEFQQAIVNRKLAPELETVFVMTAENNFYLSSGLVKEIAAHGGNLSGFVPKTVENALRKKLGH